MSMVLNLSTTKQQHKYSFVVSDINGHEYKPLNTKCQNNNCILQIILPVPYTTAIGKASSFLVATYDNGSYVGMGSAIVSSNNPSNTNSGYISYANIDSLTTGIYILNGLAYAARAPIENITEQLAIYWNITAPTMAELVMAVDQRISIYLQEHNFTSPMVAVTASNLSLR